MVGRAGKGGMAAAREPTGRRSPLWGSPWVGRCSQESSTSADSIRGSGSASLWPVWFWWRESWSRRYCWFVRSLWGGAASCWIARWWRLARTSALSAADFFGAWITR